MDKTRLNLKLTLDLDKDATWSELFKFVELARPCVDPDDPLLLEWDDDAQSLSGLSTYVEATDIAASEPFERPRAVPDA